MDPMAYYNDSIFMENFNVYHPGDTSLVCQNNVLLYKGETKIIHNSITVNENETVSLGTFRVSKINYSSISESQQNLNLLILTKLKTLLLNSIT